MGWSGRCFRFRRPGTATTKAPARTLGRPLVSPGLRAGMAGLSPAIALGALGDSGWANLGGAEAAPPAY
jgi:hypothetical protein